VLGGKGGGRKTEREKGGCNAVKLSLMVAWMNKKKLKVMRLQKAKIKLVKA